MDSDHGFGFYEFAVTCSILAESEEEAIAVVLAELGPALEGKGRLSVMDLHLQRRISLPRPKPEKRGKRPAKKAAGVVVKEIASLTG